MMRRCKCCKNQYPDHLVQPMAISMDEGLKYFDFCPLCALVIRNRISGLPDNTPFTGTRAGELWEEAKAKNPNWQFPDMEEAFK